MFRPLKPLETPETVEPVVAAAVSETTPEAVAEVVAEPKRTRKPRERAEPNVELKVYLPRSLVRSLKLLALEKDQTLSAVVAAALARYVPKYADPFRKVG